MFFTLLFRSMTRGWKRKALVVVSCIFGTTLIAAMLNISLDVGDKMNKELKSYGANIIVIPKTQALSVEVDGASAKKIDSSNLINEDSLPKVKMIFWRNNIVGFAPYLESPVTIKQDSDITFVGTWFNKKMVIPTGETIKTGIRQIKPWWKVQGKWPKDNSEDIIIGKSIAQRFNIKPGQKVNFSLGNSKRVYSVKVSGILESGDTDDNKGFLPLDTYQKILNIKDKVSKIEVSALTTPDNELSRRAENNPESLSQKEFDTWYCTAYVNAIAYQLEEVIPGVKAKAVRQVSESEGSVLQKIQLLVWLLAVTALVSSILGMSSLMSTSILERQVEVGLSKSIGANDSSIILPFLAEAAILGLIGGLFGYVGGVFLAKAIGASTFGTDISFKAFVLPVTLMLSIGIVWISSLSAISTIIKLNPIEVLHGK